MKKRIWFALLTAMTALLLGGCGLRTVKDMYTPPKRSAEYTSVQNAIDMAMVGLNYCAPVSGENQQSVQMADLDGDGIDEYLVFAEKSSDSSSQPLQILIFAQRENGTCRLVEVIENNGSAFEQVEYVEFDETPGYELIVGRRVSDQILKNVAVYSFANGSAEQQLLIGYSRFLVCDLDENGRGELMVLRPSEVATDIGMALLYSFENGQIARSVETELSEAPYRIKRITQGRLRGGSPAVFVASSVDDSAIVTDIYALREGQFANVIFSNESSASVQTLRNHFLYSDDIDDDGIIELPSLITMTSVSGWAYGEEQFLVRWFSMDPEGREEDKLYSFHNFGGGWYLQLDADWASRVSVEQDGTTYTFYVWDEGYWEASPLYTIYTLTGSGRDEEASQDGRFPLYRTEGIAYAGRLEAGAAEYGMTEEDLVNSFRLIQQDWQTGET